MGKGRGATLLLSKVSTTVPYCTVVVGCQFGGLGHLLQYIHEYCTMPRPQDRTAKGSTLMEDEMICPSGYKIYLWYTVYIFCCSKICMVP